METIRKIHPKTKHRIFLEQIIRIESAENYCNIILNSGKCIMLARTLKAYEKVLSLPFLRVNRSCMINIQYLSEPYAHNNKTIRMVDGKEIQISRRRSEYVLTQLSII